MKTSVIEVHDMLSVFSVDEVEQRIGEVPGVESVTVNHAAREATVRYDETRLEIADIKSAVRQRGYDSAAPAAASAGGHEGHAASDAMPAAPATPKTAPVSPASAPPADAAKQDKSSSAVAPAPAPSGDAAKQDKAAPDAASSATEVGSKKLK